MNDTILRHMALAFFASAYSDQAEEAGQPLRGEIMDQLPPTIDDAAQHAARTLYMDLERVNGKPVEELFDLLCEQCEGEGDRDHTWEMFGHYAAMQAMGHGVGLGDAFGDKARELVKVPYVEFSSASLAQDYFTPPAEAIRQEYRDSGADRRDLEHAVKRLLDECSDEFDSEEACVEFLMAAGDD